MELVKVTIYVVGLLFSVCDIQVIIVVEKDAELCWGWGGVHATC